MAPKKRMGKELLWIIGIIGLLGICGWIGLYIFSWLAWQLPPPASTRSMELADLDGDGDLDAFLANGRNEGTVPNTVLLNDGNGRFRDSGQQLGEAGSEAVILRDFDNDGDIDALVSNSWGSYLDYFWNDGSGQFPQSQDAPIPVTKGDFIVGIWRFAAAHLNDDTQIDLFLVGCCGGVSHGPDDWTTLNAYNTVWLGADNGLPQSSGQQFGAGSSEAVALADLDSDGDLDAFTANTAHLNDVGEPVTYDPNAVWFNDGAGLFVDSEQRLGNQRSYAVALGDLDNDGDQDAFVGNRGPDEIWWNDGLGQFSASEQTFGDDLTRYVFLADFDMDGDLDVFLGSDKQGYIWLNDDRDHFSRNNQSLHYSNRHAVALGDVNGDGAVDVVAGKLNDALVWLNDGAGHMRK